MDIITKNGKTVINDCYNASPLAMKRAIDSLATISFNNNSRSVALLSSMLELGPKSAEFHLDLGEYIYKSGIKVLIAIGEKAESIYHGFKSMAEEQIGKNSQLKNAYFFRDKNDFYKKMSKIIKTGDTVLVKGSRSNKMEELVERL